VFSVPITTTLTIVDAKEKLLPSVDADDAGAFVIARNNVSTFLRDGKIPNAMLCIPVATALTGVIPKVARCLLRAVDADDGIPTMVKNSDVIRTTSAHTANICNMLTIPLATTLAIVLAEKELLSSVNANNGAPIVIESNYVVIA